MLFGPFGRRLLSVRSSHHSPRSTRRRRGPRKDFEFHRKTVYVTEKNGYDVKYHFSDCTGTSQ